MVGGDTEAEGTVEICFDNLWGLVEESGWGMNDAQVVCEQLGHGTTGIVIKYMTEKLVLSLCMPFLDYEINT